VRKVIAENGVAAGRDVHVKGDINIYPPVSPKEQKLKELMPKRCHGQLDWLMTTGNVSVDRLFYVCRWQGLAAPDGTLQRPMTIWFDAFALVILCIPLIVLLFLAVSGDQRNPINFAVAAACMTGVAAALYMHLLPHLVATDFLRKLKAASDMPECMEKVG